MRDMNENIMDFNYDASRDVVNKISALLFRLQCSNYIWGINNFIVYYGASYIRDFTVFMYVRMYTHVHVRMFACMNVCIDDVMTWKHSQAFEQTVELGSNGIQWQTTVLQERLKISIHKMSLKITILKLLLYFPADNVLTLNVRGPSYLG